MNDIHRIKEKYGFSHSTARDIIKAHEALKKHFKVDISIDAYIDIALYNNTK